jgi:hypothetical protein
MSVSTNFYNERIDMEKTEIGFDKTNTFPIMVKHHIVPAADGQLEHRMDDKLRATVPPESWADYCKEWPVCRDVVDSMRLPRTETPEQTLQKAVAAMLAQSQELATGTEVIMPAEQLTEDPDRA